MTPRASQLAQVLGWLALVAVFALAVAVGCIRRYPAPTTPVPASMPYSAVATWRGIELPVLPGEGEALPARALRLALGPAPSDLFADTALVDGTAGDGFGNNRQPTAVDDDLEAALALLEPRSEAVVVLADQALWPGSAVLCAHLRPLGERVRLAVGPSGHDHEGPGLRPGDAGQSRDPLASVGLERLCPAQEAADEPDPVPGPAVEPDFSPDPQSSRLLR